MGNFSNLAKGVETWGLAHWTYIVVAIIANLVGVFLHF